MSTTSPPVGSWGQGRGKIDSLIEEEKLQKVTASRTHANRLLKQAQNHLASSASTAEDDPEGSYALLYTAARKSLTAVLEVQGLRPTTKGGHVVISDALKAQIDPPLGRILVTYNRLRRSRHDSEYPPVSEPELTADDVRQDLDKAKEIVKVSEKLMDQLPIY